MIPEKLSFRCGSPSLLLSNRWLILTYSLIFGIVTFGIRFSFGVFFEPLEVDLGVGRAEVSIVFSVNMGFMFASALLWGWIMDRYGPKVVILSMGLLTAISLLMSGLAGSIWQIYVSYGFLLGLGLGANNNVIVSVVSGWFKERRGLALGIATSGIGLGTMVMAPLSGELISRFGWRGAYLILAGLSLTIMIPAAFVLQMPLQWRARIAREVSERRFSKKAIPKRIGGTFIQGLMSKRKFWVFFFIYFFEAYCIFMVLSHIVRHGIDLGIPSTKAATLLALISGPGIVGRLFAGGISDRIGRRVTFLLCTLCMAACMPMLMFAEDFHSMYQFCILWGFFYGAIGPIVSAWILDAFSMRDIGKTLGMLTLGWTMGAFLGPMAGGVIYDIWGGYGLSFLSGLIALLLSMVPAFLRSSAVDEDKQIA